MRKAIVLSILMTALALHAQQSKPDDEHHHAGVTSRGDHAMGFSHDKTTHHFRLYANGGAIEVTANDPKDTDSRDMIRMHLAHIAKMFAAGDFHTPMFIHDTEPPGTAVMTELRRKIRYDYEDVPAGGRVRIETGNARALEAVHQFLRFQIADHETGDSTQVQQ